MRHRVLRSIGLAALIALVAVTLAGVAGRAQTQDAVPAPETATAATTPWGEPNLQGLWAVDLVVPLERPDGVTTEFYTEEEVAGLDDLRRGTSLIGNHLRAEPGTEADVAGAYNAVFTSQRPTGQRTAMLIDPPERETAAYHAGGARASGGDAPISSWRSCEIPWCAGTTCPAAAAGRMGRRPRGARSCLRSTRPGT